MPFATVPSESQGHRILTLFLPLRDIQSLREQLTLPAAPCPSTSGSSYAIDLSGVPSICCAAWAAAARGCYAACVMPCSATTETQMPFILDYDRLHKMVAMDIAYTKE